METTHSSLILPWRGLERRLSRAPVVGPATNAAGTNLTTLASWSCGQQGDEDGDCQCVTEPSRAEMCSMRVGCQPVKPVTGMGFGTRQAQPQVRQSGREVERRDRLGGLIHEYYRAG